MPNDNEGSPRDQNLVKSPEDQQDPVALADQGERVDPRDVGPARYAVSVHLDPDTIAAIGVPWWTKLLDLWKSYTIWQKFKVGIKALCALFAVSFANKIVDRPAQWISDMIVDPAVALLCVICAAP